jgi:hypothetical protein
LLVADSVADVKLIEAVKGVTDIGATQNAVDAIVGARVVLVIDIEDGLASAGEPFKKPVALRVERFVQLSLQAVGVPKLKIGAQLGALSPHVHEGDSAAQCEGNVLRLRAVDNEGCCSNGGAQDFSRIWMSRPSRPFSWIIP